jgi:5-methyltetrahydrofolate--homocysteine methyltransferase
MEGLTLSTDQKSGLVFLGTLREIKRVLPGAKTISGLSNISFGLPKRELINKAFLILAVESGMDAVILDITDKEMLAMLQATETLLGTDLYRVQYLKAYRDGRLDF